MSPAPSTPEGSATWQSAQFHQARVEALLQRILDTLEAIKFAQAEKPAAGRTPYRAEQGVVVRD